MTDVTPPDSSAASLASGDAASPDEAASPAPAVVVAVTVVAGTDPQATLDAVSGQDTAPASVVLVGGADTAAPHGLVLSADLEEVVAGLDASIDYVWILHGDAEPRPDALRALIEEAERHEASLAGSKLLVAGTKDTLESVGSATDIFGEPYSGLDEGEVDLEQYDVVRDVAFVNSVSVLVRRDLLRGLGGLDSILAPMAAGLDLSQRVRIAGGRVIVVPSSEVFHRRRCGRGDGGWREQSGRLRAMIKTYRPITLAWMIPFALVTGILDSLGSLLLGRWRLIPRYLLTWAWNLVHLPSTLAARRRLKRVRQVGDEEVFRYQVKGSVRLRLVGSELSDRLLGVFDEERALSRRATEAWNSSGTWGALIATLLILVGLRSVFLGPLPAVGYSLPLEDEPLVALSRFFGGWNVAGLGTDAPVHPATGAASLFDLVMLGDGSVARSVLTVIAFIAGAIGLGRLGARLNVGGVGAYLGGVAAMFGAPAALIAAGGRWSALIGLALLPWAMISMLGPPLRSRREWWGAWGRSTLAVGLVALFLPLAAVVPLLFAIGVRLIGRFPVRLGVALASVIGGLAAVPYLVVHQRLLLFGVPLTVDVAFWPMLALAVAVVAGMLAGSWRVSAVAGVMAGGGLLAAKFVGPELQVALLAAAGVGVGLAVASALRRWEKFNLVKWLAAIAGVALLALSLTGLAGGRGGLESDVWDQGLAFIDLEPHGVERALLLAPTPDLLPGESRRGPGFWYRLIDSKGPTLDQSVLGRRGDGDGALHEAVNAVAAGASLTPGEVLAPFGIRWVVAVEATAIDLQPVLDAQTDLDPLPVSASLTVYENTANRPVAVTGDGVAWERDGTGFAGEATDARVHLAVQGDGRWQPDWQAEEWAGSVAGTDGSARFSGATGTLVVVAVGVVLLVVAGGVAVAARGTERI